MNITQASKDIHFCIFRLLPEREAARLAFTCRVLKDRVYRYFQEVHPQLVVDCSFHIDATKLVKWPPLPHLQEINIALLHQTAHVILPLLAAQSVSIEIRDHRPTPWICSLVVRVTNVESLQGRISLPLSPSNIRTVVIHLLNKDGALAWRHTLPSGGLWEKAKQQEPVVHAPVQTIEYSDDESEPSDPSSEEPDDSELARMAEHDANEWWAAKRQCLE
jgi:hypothetical protein